MQVKDAKQYGMFNNVQSAASTRPQVQVEKTKAEDFAIITKEMKTILRKSLRKERWEGLDLGQPTNYTHSAVTERWTTEKNKWLNVSRVSAS